MLLAAAFCFASSSCASLNFGSAATVTLGYVSLVQAVSVSVANLSAAVFCAWSTSVSGTLLYLGAQPIALIAARATGTANHPRLNMTTSPLGSAPGEIAGAHG